MRIKASPVPLRYSAANHLLATTMNSLPKTPRSRWLLAGFLAALLLLPWPFFALLVAGVVGLTALEWSRLCGLSTTAGRFYTAAMMCGFGVLVWIAQYALPAPAPALWLGVLFASATLFWIVAAFLPTLLLSVVSFGLLSFLFVVPCLWFLYRMVKGLLRLIDARPIP